MYFPGAQNWTGCVIKDSEAEEACGDHYSALRWMDFMMCIVRQAEIRA